jgi:hypothetical protein
MQPGKKKCRGKSDAMKVIGGYVKPPLRAKGKTTGYTQRPVQRLSYGFKSALATQPGVFV